MDILPRQGREARPGRRTKDADPNINILYPSLACGSTNKSRELQEKYEREWDLLMIIKCKHKRKTIS